MNRALLKTCWLLAAGLLALLSGCATLPDVAPYRDATVQLRSAVLASGNAVGGELENAALAVDGQDRATLQDSSRKFSDSWTARIESADALVAYAGALAEIAKAGKEGGDTARSLAGALTQLAGGVGIALPSAGAVATLTDTAAFVYAQVAAVRASRSLEEALVTAQPAVNEIAAKFGKDLDASLTLIRAAYEFQRIGLAARYNDESAFIAYLDRERHKLYGEGDLTPEKERRIKEIAELYETTRSWREPMNADFAKLKTRYEAERQVIVATKTAVFEWASAHRGLAVAVREGRAVNVEGLIHATLEARELVRRLRAL